MKKVLALFLAVCLVVTLFAGCGTAKKLEKTGKIQIVATIFPLYDFAKQIVGDKADVTLLLPPGSESHSYEPTTQDIKKIQSCDLFLYIGGESDSWVDSILKSLGTPVNTLKLIDKVKAVDEESVNISSTSSLKESEEGKVEYDEHIWTSLQNAETMSCEIATSLCSADEENAIAYDTNYTNYLKKLEALDGEFTTFFSTVKNKTLVFGDRFPFRYFADEYGLKYYAAFPGCSSETEPSASVLAFLINKVKAEKIGTVFYIEFSNHLVADSIAESTGAKTALLHSCHNVSQADIDKGTSYLSLMTKNLETLKGALK